MGATSDLKEKLIITFYIIFLCLGFANATTPEHVLVKTAIPFFLIAASFFCGVFKLNINNGGKLILMIVQGCLLWFTFNKSLFILNIFLLSLLVWSIITPRIIQYRLLATMVFIIPVFLSFIIPYYKLQIPLVFFLYFPFFLFGYSMEGLNLIKNKMTKIYCVLGIIMSSAALFLISIKCLNPDNVFHLIYNQIVYTDKVLFVFSPLITVSFLVFGFSALILLTEFINLKGWEHRSPFNSKYAIMILSLIMPLIYFVNTLQLNKLERKGLFFAALLIFAALYVIAHKRSRLLDEEYKIHLFEIDFNINKVYIRLFFTVFFVLFLVLSIEYVLRDKNMEAILQYMTTASFSYNLIFVSILFLAVASLLGFKLGAVIIFVIHLLLVVANFVKLKYFDEPFYPWDTFLLNDALIIAKEYINTSLIVIISALFLIGIFFVIKNIKSVLKALKPAPNLIFAFVMAIALAFNFYILNINGLKEIKVLKDWYDSINEFLRNGTYVETYLYLKDLNQYLNNKPEGYSASKMKQIKSEIALKENNKSVKPNVIVILSETFWDPTQMNDVSFNLNITPNLKQYQSGTMISPRYGGGTANVEFEVLTGLTNFYFNKGIIPYNIYFKRNTPSIVDVFKQNGYTATAVHPNTGSMYNRNAVYNYLGFDKFYDIAGFNPEKDKKGNFVSDEKFMDKIVKTLKEGDSPQFIFGITIQNHDPYTKGIKSYTKRDVQAKSDKLDSLETEILSNFSQGVYDADRSVGKLFDEIKKTGKPTLVYYFGDHLPRLGHPLDSFDIFKKLGFGNTENPLGDIEFFKTPLITWSNYKKMTKFDTPISSNQLAVEILKDTELAYPSYFDFLMELREKYPYLNNYLVDKNQYLNDELLKKYYLIQYDILFGSQYILEGAP
ncbi:MAG: LTA synthase family protein [Clostridia bacterium]|nr:LTA synthase family protein [Clostridia bacterium]